MDKILKIANGRGFYLNSEGAYELINTITADDLIRIFNIVMELEDFTYDEYDEKTLHNSADKIIYQKITYKLSNLISNKELLIREVNSEYQELIEKYNL